MNYIALSAALRSNKMYLLTSEDIRNLFPREKNKTIKNNLTRWVAKGYFLRLKKDFYEFVEQGSEIKIPDLYVANRMYEPSYVSLETALSIYNIIPEVSAGVTSVTTRLTRTYKNKYGSFFYRTCKSEVFTGYRLMKYDGFKINIADEEKAVVDFLYFHLRSGYPVDYKEERFNIRILKKLNWKKAQSYAGLFNKKTINELVKCKEYAGC